MDDFLKQLRTKLSRSKVNLSVGSDAKTKLIDEIVTMVQEQLVLPESVDKTENDKPERGRLHIVAKKNSGGRGVIAHKSGATIMTETASQEIDVANPMRESNNAK